MDLLQKLYERSEREFNLRNEILTVNAEAIEACEALCKRLNEKLPEFSTQTAPCVTTHEHSGLWKATDKGSIYIRALCFENYGVIRQALASEKIISETEDGDDIIITIDGYQFPLVMHGELAQKKAA